MPDGTVALVYGYLDARYGTVDPGDGDLDRGKLLPDDAETDAAYLHTGELLLARNTSWSYDDVAWLVAYRPE